MITAKRVKISWVVDNFLQELELDASLDETHSGDIDVPEHAVETGSNITDNLRAKNRTLSIKGLISNTPSNYIQNSNTLRTVTQNGFEFQTSSVADSIAGKPGVAEDAYSKLQELRLAGVLVNVSTGIEAYTNLALTSLSVPRNVSIGDALEFSATFKEIRFVTTNTSVSVTKYVPAKPRKKEGDQTPKTAPEEVKKKSSIFYDAKEKGKEYFEEAREYYGKLLGKGSP